MLLLTTPSDPPLTLWPRPRAPPSLSRRPSFLSQTRPARACALWPRLDPTPVGAAFQRPRPSRLRGGNRATHCACSNRGAPDSALGWFRAFPPLCFKLRTAFFSSSWGGPRGSGAPLPLPASPRVRPLARRPRRRSVSPPRPAWPARPLLRPRPRPVVGRRLRAQRLWQAREAGP